MTTNKSDYARDVQYFTGDPRFVRLREQMEDEEPRRTPWLWLFAVAFGLAGFLAGFALGDEPTLPTGPGWETCMDRRC